LGFSTLGVVIANNTYYLMHLFFPLGYSLMVRINTFLLLLCLCFAVNGDPILGEVKCFAFNFAPPGFLKADGQLLSISANSALFSLLGKF